MKNDEKHQLKWAELSINDEDCHTICMGVYSETLVALGESYSDYKHDKQHLLHFVAN